MMRLPRGVSFVELSLLLVAFVIVIGGAYRMIGKRCATSSNNAAAIAASGTNEEHETVGMRPHPRDRK